MIYEPKQVINMLKTYNDDVHTLKCLVEEYNDSMEPGADAMAYGTDAIMPKGNSISDPTFKKAKRLMKNNNVIHNLEQKIAFIDNNAYKLHKDQHIIVFALRIQGHTCQYIADTLRVKRTRVQNIINEIAQVMCKSNEEYKQYKQKHDIA
ncbi:hypothetical protein [Staphylococcus nepalensis]|uniref:hypothetical protein n=1 Tax=Staphylococcus nepalensis TaxID=214473 RepID=UPI000BC357DE|nr:hypothetical protein [Staphylococcus nepalensis]ATH60207.1 hypothetical protein BJD96_07770 [Staphylococcus nepalensis]